jgi:hypothetical protein
MTDKGVIHRLRELDRLYAEHANNQNGESLQVKNQLHRELSDKYTSLKTLIKQKTELQWYEPVYTYAISGNLDYIAAVRKDLAQIMDRYTGSTSSEP